MFIEKITICNMFAYYEEVNVEFKKDNNKNIYCIYGNNGFGKTSFIRCAKLLFLGTGILDNANTPDIIARFAPKIRSINTFIFGNGNWSGIFNKSAISEAKDNFYISFCGMLDNKKLAIKRSWKGVIERNIEEVLEFYIDNEGFSSNEAQMKINNILPPKFVEFFFFDGEEIEKISDNLRTSLREKIEDILCISPLDRLIKQIGSYKNELITQESNDKQLQNTLISKSNELENINSQLEGLNDNIKDSEYKINKIKDEINAKNKEIEKLILNNTQERDGLYEEKNNLESNKEKYREYLRNNLKYIVFMGNKNLLESLKNEVKNIESNKNIKDLAILENIIKEIKQECSLEFAKLDNKDILNDTLSKSLDKIYKKNKDKQSYSSLINNTDILKELFIRLENNDIESNLNKIIKLNNELENIKVQLDELEIDDYFKDRKESLRQEINDLDNTKERLKNIYEDSKNKQRELKQNQEDLEKDIDRLKQNIRTERIDNKLKILESLNSGIKAYKENLIKTLRNELKIKIIKNYKQLLENDNVCDVEIDDNFIIKLKNSNNEAIIIENQSSGQKQILAICIFWALSELSHSQIPLIIDTPLARIDKDNRINIIQKYYSSTTQAIILPTNTEISRNEYEYVKPYMAGIYKIDNDSSRQHARIKIANIDEIL